jgi:ABC-type multidrug transport system fused ATPase/permease subunit
MVLSTAPRYLLEFILVLFIAVLVVLAHTVEEGTQQLIPVLGVFGFAAIRLLPVASSSTAALIGLRFARDSVSRLYHDVSEHDFDTTVDEHDMGFDTQFQSLSIQGVTYRYSPEDHAVLDQLSMDINAGESVGIIGPSGSGKTTLIDVLLGLLEPQEGTILFNGQSVDLMMKQWRSHVAYLPQQVFLIDDTLGRNVALGVDDDAIDTKRVTDALDKARLSELVAQLPDGIGTIMGERGARLSGGQRQRVALARAFYHERDVLVMDEATSALDVATENEIVEEIQHLKGEKTLIVIAHRLTTVRHCDRIYKLENGRIIASGSPDEMLGDAALQSD